MDEAKPARMSERRLYPHRADWVAGVSVAALAIPQSLAYAEIAGMPAHIGLLAAALPPIAAGIFASSRYLQTGPVAMTSLLTFGALQNLAVPGSYEYVQAGVVLAIIVGLVRIVLGLLKAGVLAYLMSQPVLVGFSSAAAILIVASQVELVCGATATDGPLLGRAIVALSSPGDWNSGALMIAAMAAGLVLGGKRVHRLFPGVLFAVILGIVLNNSGMACGETLDAIPSLAPGWPSLVPWASFRQLIIPGGVIAIVGFAEPAAIARTLAARDRSPWDPDREFISQGVANLVAGLCGAFPVGGSFSRSSVAKLAGAQSQFTGLISGILVLAFLPFSSLLSNLPRAVLGAIVIVATVRLIRIGALLRLTRISWGQSFVAWSTFASTLIFSPRVDLGLIVGIGLATVVHLRRETMIRLGTTIDDQTLILSPSGVLYFGSAPGLSQTLVDQLAAHQDIQRVIVDLARLGRIDYTGVMEIKAFADACAAAGLGFQLRGIPGHAQGTLTRCLGDELETMCADC